MSSSRTLVTLGLATGLLACAPVRSQGGDPADPLALVDRLVDARPWTRRAVEQATAVTLVPNAAASNPFYSLWISEHGAGFLARVELREPGLGATRRAIDAAVAAAGAGGEIRLRTDKSGHAFVTDGGHWILDAALGRLSDPQTLARALSAIPGVVEHGLFIGLAQAAILAGPSGVRVIERP